MLRNKAASGRALGTQWLPATNARLVGATGSAADSSGQGAPSARRWDLLPELSLHLDNAGGIRRRNGDSAVRPARYGRDPRLPSGPILVPGCLRRVGRRHGSASRDSPCPESAAARVARSPTGPASRRGYAAPNQTWGIHGEGSCPTSTSRRVHTNAINTRPQTVPERIAAPHRP